jgi:hypothetical protein
VHLFFASFGNAGPTMLAHLGLTSEVLGRNAGAFVEVLTLLKQVVGVTFPAGSAALASRILSLAHNEEKKKETLKYLHDEGSAQSAEVGR